MLYLPAALASSLDHGLAFLQRTLDGNDTRPFQASPEKHPKRPSTLFLFLDDLETGAALDPRQKTFCWNR